MAEAARFLSGLTAPEAAEAIAGGAVVLVPVGAAAKAHGPHLPMDTDARVATALAGRVAERVADRLPVLVAPTVTAGYYPAFVGYPGSQHLRAETFVALMEDLLGGFVAQGARRLAVLNTGVSTEAPLALAIRAVREHTGVAVALANLREAGRSADTVLEQALGGHADERETSVMLALDPAAVRMDRARPDYGHRRDAPKSVFRFPATLSDAVDPAAPGAVADYSETGAIGDPSLATAEKGEAILDAMVAELADGLLAAFGS